MCIEIVNNTVIRYRYGIKEDAVRKIEKVMLRFGHMDWMNEGRMTK